MNEDEEVGYGGDGIVHDRRQKTAVDKETSMQTLCQNHYHTVGAQHRCEYGHRAISPTV